MFIKLYGIITISLWWFQNVIFLKKHKQSTDININDKQKVKTEYNQNNNGFENIITNITINGNQNRSKRIKLNCAFPLSCRFEHTVELLCTFILAEPVEQ